MDIFSSAIRSTNKLIAYLYIIYYMCNKHFIQSYGSYYYRLLETWLYNYTYIG